MTSVVICCIERVPPVPLSSSRPRTLPWRSHFSCLPGVSRRPWHIEDTTRTSGQQSAVTPLLSRRVLSLLHIPSWCTPGLLNKCTPRFDEHYAVSLSPAPWCYSVRFTLIIISILQNTHLCLICKILSGKGTIHHFTTDWSIRSPSAESTEEQFFKKL